MRARRAIAVAACGSNDKKSSGGSSSAVKGPDITAKGEGRLDIVNWEGYTDKSFVKPFEQQTGCKVNAVFAGTSDEMFTKFRAGGGGQYDLASFSGDASLRAIKSGAVGELDRSKLTNFNDLAPQLQSPAFNTVDGKHYGLSFVWGANVLIYNTDKIKETPTPGPSSTTRSTRARSRCRTTRSRSPTRRCSSSARGTRTRSTRRRSTRSRPSSRRSARSCASTGCWRPTSRSCSSRATRSIGAGWPLMTNDLKKAGLNVKEVIPKEGVTGWSDSWMLSNKAKHPICAYQCMNYVTTPKVQKQVADVTGYSPANTKTCDVVGPQACKDLHITDSKYYDTIKYWETPTAPTNYRQWTDAWAQVKG